jgi:hypothetical protein
MGLSHYQFKIVLTSRRGVIRVGQTFPIEADFFALSKNINLFLPVSGLENYF